MNTATIFYNDARKLAGENDVFDCRFDTQILPAGSVACGFMSWQGAYQPISELLEPPAMTAEQEQNWNAVIEEARTILQGE